jgi:hypothetical protein
MAKKKTVGNVIELDLPQTIEVPAKKKKELSEKQRENLSKGMAILKANREAKSKKQEVEVAEAAEEPVAAAPVAAPVVAAPPVVAVAPEPVAPVVKKERKPRVIKNYLTTEDFNSFKSELLTTLKPNAVAPVVPVVQREVPSVQPVAIKERVISGSALLDRIFFNK